MTQGDDETTAAADGLEQHVKMLQARDYLSRGRRFAQDDVEAVKRKWIAALRAWYSHGGSEREREMEDLAAELHLRNLEPPYDSVRAELTMLRAELARQDSVHPEVRRLIREFVRDRGKPPH